jgi:hypothetical protein
VEDFLGSRHAATLQRTDYLRQSVSIVANFAALRGKCPVVLSKNLTLHFFETYELKITAPWLQKS